MFINDLIIQRIFLFIYLLPAFQATIFNVTLGHEPKDLKMAIVNDEVNSRQGQICNYTTDCSYSMLSCRYLRYVNKNIIQVKVDFICWESRFIDYVFVFFKGSF